MPDFSVGMEWVSKDISPDIFDEDQFDVLNEVLKGFSPSFTFREDRYGIRLTVRAGHAREALDIAVEASEPANRRAGLPAWPLTTVEIVEWSEFERQLAEPTHPQIIGISELAQLLGVTRQRASVLARSRAFPRPVANLASGPVWFETMVRRFAESWERKKGRPRKTEADMAAVQGATIEATQWDKEVMMPGHPGFPG